MRQSISTKYLGPSRVRGSRVKATTSSGLSITLSWDDATDSDTNHKIAAARLAEKLGWSGRWEMGAIPSGCIFVNVDGSGFNINETI